MELTYPVVANGLLIRQWDEDDAEDLAQATTDSLEHLRPFMPWVANEPMSIEARRALITEWNHDDAAGASDLICGLFANGRVVGGAGLHHRVSPSGLEIGYWVRVDEVRKGYASTASAALTDIAFTEPAIDFVIIKHDAANTASSGIPRKLGFTRIDDEQVEKTAPATTGVHWVWRVTRDEWAALR